MREELSALAGFIHATRRLLGTVPQRPVAIVFTFVTLNPTKFWARGTKTMQMTDIQSSVATIDGEDAEGNLAVFDNPPVWESSDESIVMVEPAPDGLSCVVKSPSPGPLGSAVITVRAQANGVDVVGTGAVDIVGSAAVKINLNFGTPSP